MLIFAVVALPLVGWRIASHPALDPSQRNTAIGASGSGRRFTVSPPFDLTRLSLARERVLNGGPPKDGIPALTDPAFIEADQASFLAGEDEVIGVVFGGEARAYPLRMLDSHEVVNDRVGGRTIAVTYCPLCDSSAVFDRSADEGGTVREFGVSGLLFNSNVLMYDRRKEGVESLWTQMGSIGVSGPAVGTTMRRLPVEVTTWASWKARHPETTVVAPDSNPRINYRRSPYARYFAQEELMFPVDPLDERMPAKTRVLGVKSGQASRAYRPPHEPLSGSRRETLGDCAFDLIVDGETGRLRIENVEGEAEWCYSFWFAWAAFNQESELVEL